MMRLTRFAAALAVAALAMTSTVRAETKGKTGNAEVVGGWYWAQGTDLSDDPDAAPVFGLRMGYNFTSRFGMQGSVEWLDTEYDLPAPLTGQGDISAAMARVDLVWNVNPDDRAVFHVFGGPGYSWVTTDVPVPLDPSAEDDDSIFTLNLGVGVSIYATEHFYIRPDLSARWYADDEDGDGHTDVEATIGLGWQWGGN